MAHSDAEFGGVRVWSALVPICALVLGSVVACGGSSSGGAAQPAPSVSSSASVAADTSVTSSIKTGAVLRKALHWNAAVKAADGVMVTQVDFLIDGRVRWTEHEAPYQFNEGRLFAPWPLGGGKHRLAVNVVASGGSTAASTAVDVQVKVPPMSGLPVGSYRRTVTAADQKRVKPYRDFEHGAFGETTPTGQWSLTVRQDGVLLLDEVPHPHGTDAYHVPFAGTGQRITIYDSAGWLQPNPERGNMFCEPEKPSDYQWSLSGSTLTLKALEHVCADRDIALVGSWHRV